MGRGWKAPSVGAVAAALVLDDVFGDPSNRWHPVRWLGVGLEGLERMVYADSTLRGALYWGLALLPAVAVPVLLAPGGVVSDAIALWLTLGGGSLRREATTIAELLEAGDLALARRRLRNLVGRDTEDLDGTEICRAVIESVAENTTDAVIGPLLWYAVGGIGTAIAFRTWNTLDAMVGHRTDRYEHFGYVAAKVDDLAAAPAAVLGVLATWLLANPSQRGVIGRALVRAARHPSLNAGMIEAAFAGFLGVELGGLNVYGGRAVHTPRFGGSAVPTPAVVYRAVRLSSWVERISALVVLVSARVRR